MEQEILNKMVTSIDKEIADHSKDTRYQLMGNALKGVLSEDENLCKKFVDQKITLAEVLGNIEDTAREQSLTAADSMTMIGWTKHFIDEYESIQAAKKAKKAKSEEDEDVDNSEEDNKELSKRKSPKNQ